MVNIFQLMPYLEGDEMRYIQELIKDFDESQAQQFSLAYSSRRKDPTTILILAVVGLLGVAGIHRFILGQIGMGILYFFTAGLCLDMVNYKKLAFDFNSREAQNVASMIRNFSQS